MAQFYANSTMINIFNMENGHWQFIPKNKNQKS